jgi:hemoglobin
MSESHMAMNDIGTEADVKRLVDEFYRAVRKDNLLEPIFSQVAQVEWEHHLPRMYAFWSGLILGVPGYSGQPFAMHARLSLTRDHFDRWLEVFHGTVDAHFTGPRAQRAKDTAVGIAHTFALRLGLIEPRLGRKI